MLKKNQNLIFENTPAGVNPAALVKKALFAIQANPRLLDCDKDSLFMAVYESAVNGLEIGGIRSEAYLVPYGEKVQLIPGYKGLISLVRRTGKLVDVTMECVHQGDTFEATKGDEVKLVHRPSDDPKREQQPVTHVYVIFHMVDGSKVRNVWTSAQVNAHRDRYSEGYRRAEAYLRDCEKKKAKPDPKKLSPWHNNWAVMAYKTLIRDAINRGRLPLSDAVLDLVNREDDRGGASDAVEQAAPAQISYEQEFSDVLQEFGDEEDTVLESPPQTAAQLEQPQPPVFAGIQDPVFLERLAACTSLGHVTALDEGATELCQDDDERAYVREMCAERAEQIRAARSKLDKKSS